MLSGNTFRFPCFFLFKLYIDKFKITVKSKQQQRSFNQQKRLLISTNWEATIFVYLVA